MVTPRVGWGVTSRLVVRTRTSGTFWRDVTARGCGGTHTIDATMFLDARHAWVVASQRGGIALVQHTSDAGQTWHCTQVHVTGPRQAGPGDLQIDVIDPRHGWLMAIGEGIFANALALFRTTDGGAHWTKIAAHLSFSDLLGFHSITVGFAAVIHGGGAPAVPGALYVTHDGGHVWHIEPLPIPSGFRTSAVILHRPVFSGRQDGVLPETMFFTRAAKSAALEVYITHNGGKSWRATSPLRTRTPDETVDFISSQRGWTVVGTTLYATTDSGQHWTTVLSSVRWAPGQRLDFVTSRVGFALASPLTPRALTGLLKTTDGGYTWKIIQPQLVP